MDVIDALNKRHSVRDFSEKPVDQSALDEIVSACLNSPSASNTQPYLLGIAQGQSRDEISKELLWRFDRVNRIRRGSLPLRGLRTVLSGALPDGDYSATPNYPNDLVSRSRECGAGLYGHLGIERGDSAARDLQLRRNFEFFNAPVVMFVFHHGKMGAQSAFDAGIFLQSLMLAAVSRGLGTCAQASLSIWAGPVRKRFKVPKDYKLICGLSLGYPSDDYVNQYRTTKQTTQSLILPPR